MSVVEVMEVTQLFVEVKSFQRSKSLRVKEPKSDSMAGEFNMVPDRPTYRHLNLLSCLGTAKNIRKRHKYPRKNVSQLKFPEQDQRALCCQETDTKEIGKTRGKGTNSKYIGKRKLLGTNALPRMSPNSNFLSRTNVHHVSGNTYKRDWENQRKWN